MRFFRIGVENVREPDSEKIIGVTKGQFYSLFMIAIGLAFWAWAWKSKKSLKDDIVPWTIIAVGSQATQYAWRCSTQ
jgi:prolipoprotein diacylglyceryltransferase